MSVLLRALVASVLVGSSLGCGSHAEDSEVPAAAPAWSPPTAQGKDYRDALTSDAPVLEACERYAAAELAYESRCTIALHPAKLEYYRARFKLACRVAASEPGAGFDVRAIDACSAALVDWRDSRCANRPSIGSLRSPLEVCASYLTGTLAAGESCTQDGQCTSGTCNRPFLVGLAAHDGDTVAYSYTGCGTCARVVSLGQSCDAPRTTSDASHVASVCEEGISCPTTASTNGMSTCTAGASAGEECGFYQVACATGLTCRYLSKPEASFRCISLKPEGAGCDEQNECAAAMVCRGGRCERQGVEGDVCRVAGASVPFDTGCVGALACSPASLRCEPVAFGALKAANEPCGRSLVQADECRYGAFLCANDGVSICPAARRAEGDACKTSAECDSVSLCVAGVCQPLSTRACKDRASIE